MATWFMDPSKWIPIRGRIFELSGAFRHWQNGCYRFAKLMYGFVVRYFDGVEGVWGLELGNLMARSCCAFEELYVSGQET